jgi:lactoylglutathione lyase
MKIDHVAIWTKHLEELKDFYVRHFCGRANKKYINRKTHFESYFLTFDSGSSLELMTSPDIKENRSALPDEKHQGLIHLAFGVDTMEEVTEKSEELAREGFIILRGPRKTGDGYYEFETLDPDSNLIEVSTLFIEKV